MVSSKDNLIQVGNREERECQSYLEELVRQGAQQMLQAAIQNEVAEYIKANTSKKDEQSHRLVTRNGSLPERELQTGIGGIAIKQPRVNDRRENQSFSSKILPPYMRRLPSIDALIPALYLKGISTGDMQEALESILGPKASGLSATNVVRLKEGWAKEYATWQTRDLSDKNYVYLWADGIYFNVRLDDDRPCILVVIGALEDGTKEVIAIHDGQRESKLSWKEVMIDMKKRGLKHAPKLAVGDGALGFWSALEEVFPETKAQRCWVHKTANVLNKLPKSVQPSAKKMINEMYMSPTKKEGLKALNSFVEVYEAKYPKACNCLIKDQDVLFTFYDFPAQHWAHLRTTNPIESTFSTVRHRTRQTKGCGSRKATLMMVFKLAEQAEKHWKRLNGYDLISQVIEGVKFKDGEIVKPETKAA